MDARMQDLVRGAFELCSRINPEHLSTLWGQRRYGSQFGNWFPLRIEDVLDPMTGFELVPHSQLPNGTAMTGCLYFRTKAPHVIHNAIEQVAALNALPPEMQQGVEITYGDHGPRLVTDRPLEIKPAEEVWLILGPVSGDDSRLIPYTFIVGQLLCGWNTETDGPIPSIQTLIATRKPYAVTSTHT
jgi:hypothetical protein